MSGPRPSTAPAAGFTRTSPHGMARAPRAGRDGRPRRAVGLALAILLTAATALAMAGLALTLGGSFLPAAPAAAAGETDLARRFYAAANAVLAGAEPSVFDPLLAPACVDHEPDGPALDQAGWAARLAATGRAAPGARLEVTTIVADGAWVAAQTNLSGAAVLAAGASLAGLAAPTTDLLQLAGGRVVGYWPGAALADPPQALPSVSLGQWAAPAIVSLARVVYPPGTALTGFVAPGPQLILAESGRLSVRLDGAAAWFVAAHPESGWQTTSPTGQELTLAPGDALLAAAGVEQTVRNLDPDPAAALDLETFPTAALYGTEHRPTPDVPQSIAMFNPAQQGTWRVWPSGVRVDVLASGFGPMGGDACLAAPVELTITRFALPAGGVIPAHPVRGVALLARAGGWLDGDGFAAAGTPDAQPAPPTLAEQGLTNVDYQLGPVRNLGAWPLDLVLFALAPTDTFACRHANSPAPTFSAPASETRERGP
jgi:SnoaL-like protein